MNTIINICDITIANYLKEFLTVNKLSENKVRMRKIIRQFPFCKLAECDSVDQTLIITVTDILSNLVKSPLFHQKNYVDYTIDFVLNNVVFSIKTPKSTKVVAKLLNLLYEICRSFTDAKEDLRKFLNLERICDVLLMLFRSNSGPIEISCGRKALVAILANKSVDDLFDGLKSCIEETYKTTIIVDNKKDLFKIFLLSLKKSKIPSDLSEAFKWMETAFASYIVDDDLDMEILYLGTDAVLMALSKGHELKEFNERLYDELKNNICHLCRSITCINSNEIKERLELLLYYLLKRECCKLNLNWYKGFEQLRYELNEIIKETDWSLSKYDVFFFIAYLQCLNNSIQWPSASITRAIKRRIIEDQFMHPLLLKSIGFLCSVYNTELYPGIKLYILSQLNLFKNLINCHPIQLKWIIKEGPLELKYHALKMSLRSNDMTTVLSLKDFEDAKLLIDYIVLDDDIENKQRVIEILIRKEKSIMLANYILQLIMTKNIEPEITGYLLQTEPILPHHSSRCLDLVCYLASIMHCIKDTKSLRCICRIIKRNICVGEENLPLYMALTEKPYAIEHLILLISDNNQEISCTVLSLLKRLVLLQIRRNQSAEKTYSVDLRPCLRGNQSRVQQAAGFLKLMLRCRVATPLLVVDETTILNLYQELMNLPTEYYTTTIFLCLRRLLDKFQYLIYSSCTELFLLYYFVTNGDAALLGLFAFIKKWIKLIHQCNINLCIVTLEDLTLHLQPYASCSLVKGALRLIQDISERDFAGKDLIN